MTYEASRIKRRRATKLELDQPGGDLFAIVDAMKPMTVQQVFYQATVDGIVEKSESGYPKVQITLVDRIEANTVSSASMRGKP